MCVQRKALSKQGRLEVLEREDATWRNRTNQDRNKYGYEACTDGAPCVERGRI
jgi:hypothetical protein